MGRNDDPVRMCAGCRQKKPRSQLVRIVIDQDGMRYDPTGKADGRGVYVCPDRSCVERLGKMRKVAGRGRVPDEVLASIMRERELGQ